MVYMIIAPNNPYGAPTIEFFRPKSLRKNVLGTFLEDARFSEFTLVYMICNIYLEPYHMDYIIWHHFDSDRWILISLNRRFT